MNLKRIPAPIHGSWPVVKEWLGRFGPDAVPLADSTAWSPVFSAAGLPGGVKFLTEAWTTGADVSWLGGPAVAGLEDWPRNANGAPLAHVATFSLRDFAELPADDKRWPFPVQARGLPTHGTLEVFHDLGVYGWESEDADHNGWMVRWVSDPDRSHLIAPPEDLDTPSDVCQAGEFMPSWTVQSSLDVVGHGNGTFDAAERVHELRNLSWQAELFPGSDSQPTPPSHAYGHSTNGRTEILPVLERVLPLTQDGDEWCLLFDIESWTFLNGWFGDAAPLEVWIRRSDLETRRFDRAWCITRTD